MARIPVKFFALTLLIMCCVSKIEGQTDSKPVSQLCLGCICTAISSCQSNVCKGHLCGIFTISRPFWEDAGKPTIEGKSPTDSDAYVSCALDDYCAQDTVQGYMAKFKQDCNDDGRITCYDYLAIHQRGGFQCKGPLSESRLKLFNQCLAETYQV